MNIISIRSRWTYARTFIFLISCIFVRCTYTVARYAYREMCTPSLLKYVRAHLYTCYTHVRTRQGVQVRAKKQVYNREDYSGSARKEIITLRVRLTRQGTRMHTTYACDGTRHVICVM